MPRNAREVEDYIWCIGMHGVVQEYQKFEPFPACTSQTTTGHITPRCCSKVVPYEYQPRQFIIKTQTISFTPSLLPMGPPNIYTVGFFASQVGWARQILVLTELRQLPTSKTNVKTPQHTANALLRLHMNSR